MTENIQLSAQDQADIDSLGDIEGNEAAPFVPILKVWREVLAGSESVAQERIQPSWASRVCAAYPQMTFGDMPRFAELYFDKINVLRGILEAEIASDEECLKQATPEQDSTENSQHYKDLLTEWQVQFVRWENAWEPMTYDAAAYLAAMSEVHKMFFSDMGILAFLDNIKFEFTEADQAQLALAIDAAREDGK